MVGNLLSIKSILALFLFLILGFTNSLHAANHTKLFGRWKGVKMFQDDQSYDGRTFFSQTKAKSPWMKPQFTLIIIPTLKVQNTRSLKLTNPYLTVSTINKSVAIVPLVTILWCLKCIISKKYLSNYSSESI